MINLLIQNANPMLLTFCAVLFSFVATIISLKGLKHFLPKDLGREFAHQSKTAIGKPQGAGIIFIIIFCISTLVFVPFSIETLIFVLLIFGAMITGFLDDAAKTPWGEYLKGFFDFVIALLTAITFVNFNNTIIDIPFTDLSVEIPYVVFLILATVLVWVSINVTNCTDGVDGLSGTLSIITLLSIFTYNTVILNNANGQAGDIIIIMITCILGYLWFNSTPSILMMGDAGSRALGLFIAIMILKTNSPLLYLIFAFVFILDGALGLLKIALLRFLKIKILVNTRTPIHDHVRKNMEWSNTQTVYRFSIIQVLISFSVILLLKAINLL